MLLSTNQNKHIEKNRWRQCGSDSEKNRLKISSCFPTETSKGQQEAVWTNIVRGLKNSQNFTASKQMPN